MILAFISCNKNEKTGIKPTQTDTSKVIKDIYLVGNTFKPYPNQYSAATYWKNGNPVYLTDGTQIASANAIAVVGNDVYVAGNIPTSGPSIATYWKNGANESLNINGAYASYASSMAVLGSDIYVAGSITLGISAFSYPEATYWKNGNPVTLTSKSTYSIANAIFITGNDIYISGYMVDTTTGIAIAMYWKNGTPVYLSDGSSNAYANAITVGSDIYVAGSVNNRAVYWKNGISYNLQANNLVCFSASSIALNGSDVYILGTMTSALGTDPSDYAPTNFIYWKME